MVDFTRSFESSSFVPLTDDTGKPLAQVPGNPGFYELTGINESVLDFYLDSNGSRYMRVNAINITSPNKVTYVAKYGWIVNGKFKEKPAYRGMVSESVADGEIPTAYSPGEYVPIGHKHLVRIEAGEPDSGTYKIIVNVMASRY